MNNALSSFAEIKDRCEKRNTKVRQATRTHRDPDVFVVQFEDGTQANVDNDTLNELENHHDLFV